LQALNYDFEYVFHQELTARLGAAKAGLPGVVQNWPFMGNIRAAASYEPQASAGVQITTQPLAATKDSLRAFDEGTAGLVAEVTEFAEKRKGKFHLHYHLCRSQRSSATSAINPMCQQNCAACAEFYD
jgi:hypothetical protein